MSWRLASALVQLREECDDRWPSRDKRSDGTIGDAAHSSRTSDHNPNGAGVVQAVDVDEHTDRTETDESVGLWLAEALRASKDRRIKYVIYEGRMFSSYPARGVPPWTWRPGKGHTQHVHVSVVDDPNLYDDTSQWFNDEKEPDMSEAWLNRWPKWARTWAREARDKRLITEHTDPSRKLSDVTLGEFLMFLDRDKG